MRVRVLGLRVRSTQAWHRVLQAQQLMHRSANVLEESFAERRLDRIAFGVNDKLELEFYGPPAHVKATAKAAQTAARPWLSQPSQFEVKYSKETCA